MAKLHFYYSTMNAGKSTLLLQSSYNYQERGMQTLLYTPIIDDRYGKGRVSSRIGLQADAIAFDAGFDLYQDIEEAKAKMPSLRCVLVDEAQFLSKTQVRQLGDVCDRLGVPVLAYGIRSDFRGEPFEGSQYLLTWADILTEIKTICHCGKKATMVYRTDVKGQRVHSGETIDIGGNEKYVSVCRKHFREGERSLVHPHAEVS